MVSVDNMLSFLTPIYTHVFDNHSNGYDHFNTGNIQSSVDC
jgi:hypothetical protein